MRRMITDKTVIDTVNAGIESGEIEVGGGLPEIEEGDAGKVLKVNNAEDGVEWGEAGGNNVLTLDFNGATELTLSDEIAAKVKNLAYDRLVVYHYGSATAVGVIVAEPLRNIEWGSESSLKFENNVSAGYYKIINPIAMCTKYIWNANDWDARAISVPALGAGISAPIGPQQPPYFLINSSTKKIYISSNVFRPLGAAGILTTNGIGDVELTTAGGTVPGTRINIPSTGSTYSGPRGYANSYIYYYKEGDDRVILRPVQYVPNSFSCKVVLTGEHYNSSGVKDYTYVAILNCTQFQTDSSYTLTRTAV